MTREKNVGDALHTDIGSRNGRYIAVSEIDAMGIIATKGQTNSSNVVRLKERSAAAVVPLRPLPFIIVQIRIGASNSIVVLFNQHDT